jgi:hypothetical protein
MQQLTHACRQAKEQLLADATLESAPVTVLGKGRSLVGGTLRTDLQRADVEKVLVDGFFPECPRDAEPARSRTLGLQELGLPYVSDPAATKHLAHFLSRQAEHLANRERPGKKKKGGADAAALPTAVLFNGGVFKAEVLKGRVVEALNEWGQGSDAPAKVLPSADLDLSVARGAAYYGMVRRGKGVRIRGGTARTYYVGIETAAPSVPGVPAPLKALCVVPFGMEEGTEADVPGQEFGLVVGAPAEFRFLSSTVRREDAPGVLLDEWEDDIEEAGPIAATLEAEARQGQIVPVHLLSKVTEVGTLELWCISRDGKQKWKLEFNVREQRG